MVVSWNMFLIVTQVGWLTATSIGEMNEYTYGITMCHIVICVVHRNEIPSWWRTVRLRSIRCRRLRRRLCCSPAVVCIWTVSQVDYVSFYSRQQSAYLALPSTVLGIRPSVCSSACPSQCGSRSKCFMLRRSCSLLWKIAPWFFDSSFLMVNFTAKFQKEHRERGRRMREL